MAEITAGMVKELRELTGLGMMECKKALTETDGDIKKAEELMRIKSGAKASKAASRVAAEGLIGMSAAGTTAAMVEVNCETDFVSRNDDFKAFANNLAKLVIEKNPADVAALSALPMEGETVELFRQKLVQKIGENLSIRRFVRTQSATGVATYVHGVKLGVVVDFAGPAEVGKDLAMHIAATKPAAVTRDQVPAEKIEEERRVAAGRAAESGKPADIVAKMVEGSVNKYLADVTLTAQAFVKGDGKETVEQMLKKANASVKAFTMFVVGEGIEKKVENFADEVAKASQVGKPA
jgi:elongation factor Ts